MSRKYSPGMKRKRNDPVLISICILGIGVLIALGFVLKSFKDRDNEVVTGWHMVGGETFYIDNITKRRAVGLNTIGNKVYYFQQDGTVREGWANYEGKKIYVQSSGLVATGEYEIDGDIYSFAYDTYEMLTDTFVQSSICSYYFGNDGKAVKGLQRVQGHDRYFDESGMMIVSQWFKIPGDPDGLNYYADKNGFLQEGWVTLSDGDHYFTENHAAASGDVEVEGTVYSFNNYGMLSDDSKLPDKPDESAVTTSPSTTVPVTTEADVKQPVAPKEGWREVDGRKQYIGKDGNAYKGVQRIDNILYVFDSAGYLADGFIKLDNNTYYAYSDGKAATAYTKIGNTNYLFDSLGRMQTGFQNVNNVRCFFDKDGKMAHGERNIDGYTYFFSYNDNGEMQTGYISVNGRNYYHDDSGKRCTGWIQIASYWYYFASDGHAVSGYQNIDGNRYYFDSDCSLMTEAVYINGTLYYFGEDGVIREGVHSYYDYSTNTFGEAYFDADGRKVD